MKLNYGRTFLIGCAFLGVQALFAIYFIATQSAEVLGPTLLGTLLDLTGRDFRLIFAYATAALLASVLLRRGEARAPIAASA